MTDLTQKNETGLMRVFFCGFLILSTVITFAINEISGIPFYIVKSFEILISCGTYGFSFLIGYLLAKQELPSSVKEYAVVFKKRLVPFFYAIVIYWLVKLLLGDAELNPEAIARLTYSHHFYILLVILQFLILTMLFGKHVRKFNPYVFVAVCAIIHIALVFCVHVKIYKYIFVGYLFCFSAGFCAGKNYNAFKTHVLNKFKTVVWIYSIFFALTVAVYILFALKSDNFIRKMITLLLYANVCVSCIFTAAVSIKICQKPIGHGKTAKLLADSSYLTYLWHALPVIAVHNILLTSEDTGKVEGIVFKFVAALAVVATVTLVVYINKRKGNKNGTV